MFDRVFDEIAKKVPVKQEKNDYYKNGLLQCGNCKTAKQVRVEFNGIQKTPLCLCDCAKARHDAEVEAWEREQRIHRIKELRQLGFPDGEMTGWTFDKDDNSSPEISTVARRYVDSFSEMRKRGKGLLFYGTVGSGKTFLAACIANALIDKGYPCMVTNFARLTNTIGGTFDKKQQYLDSLDKFDLLVIDDLAAERDTEFMGEMVFNIIDARYRSGKPLIVTTNLSAREMKEAGDVRRQRVFSRVQEMCVPVKVVGVDRRKGRSDLLEAARILGLGD